MPRIGLEITQQAHDRLKEHAKRNRLTQGEILEVLLATLTQAQVDDAAFSTAWKMAEQKREARVLRAKLNNMDAEELKKLLAKAEP